MKGGKNSLVIFYSRWGWTPDQFLGVQVAWESKLKLVFPNIYSISCQKEQIAQQMRGIHVLKVTGFEI